MDLEKKYKGRIMAANATRKRTVSLLRSSAETPSLDPDQGVLSHIRALVSFEALTSHTSATAVLLQILDILEVEGLTYSTFNMVDVRNPQRLEHSTVFGEYYVIDCHS